MIADGLCWVSGQGGLEWGTFDLVPGGIEAETTQAIGNIERILQLAGLTLGDIVSVTVYMLDTDEWAAMNTAYGAAFAGVEVLPARTAIGVAGLPFGIRVEISVVARIPARTV